MTDSRQQPNNVSLLHNGTGCLPSISSSDTSSILRLFRNGSVLSSHNILKTDHFYTGIYRNLDLSVFGAPNFRYGLLDIYGVAQPTVPGLSTILRLFKHKYGKQMRCTWISTREEPVIYINDKPFVMREESSPFVNLAVYTGITAARLESMEDRLKADIIKESSQANGLLVVHEEQEPGILTPVVVAADRIQTCREVFSNARYNECEDNTKCIEYHRVPLSSGHLPIETYADTLLEIVLGNGNISRNKEDQRETPSVTIFNCGMGLGRTTHSMITCLLIKRHKILLQGNLDDPLFLPPPDISRSSLSQVTDIQAERKSLLRLMILLEKVQAESGITSTNEGSVFTMSSLDWLLEDVDPLCNKRTGARLHYGPDHSTSLLDGFQAAMKGDYMVISQLGALLLMPTAKPVVDAAIDACSQLLNVRESILLHRLKHSIHDGRSNKNSYLKTAATFLERYFCLIVFSAFLEEQRRNISSVGVQKDPIRMESFGTWLTLARIEVYAMYKHKIARRVGLLPLFRPIPEDLSAAGLKYQKLKKNYKSITDKNMLAYSSTVSIKNGNWNTAQSDYSSFSAHFGSVGPLVPVSSVLRARSGAVLSPYTILKHDQWQRDVHIISPELSDNLSLFSQDAIVNDDVVSDLELEIDDVSLSLSKLTDDSLSNAISDDQRDDINLNNHESYASFLKLLHFRKMSISTYANLFSIYGTAQPSVLQLKEIIRIVCQDPDSPYSPEFSIVNATLGTHPRLSTNVIWLNLREEPITYIEGLPFVLRDQYATLRNSKSAFKCIPAIRLETLEDQLVQDIQLERSLYEGRLLVHTEATPLTGFESIEPESSNQHRSLRSLWINVPSHKSIITVKDVMTNMSKGMESEVTTAASPSNPGSTLTYHRVPLTAESQPDLTDFDDIFRIVRDAFYHGIQLNTNSISKKKTAFVVNCQMGRGRSSLGMMVIALTLDYFKNQHEMSMSGSSYPIPESPGALSDLQSPLHLSQPAMTPQRPSQLDNLILDVNQDSSGHFYKSNLSPEELALSLSMNPSALQSSFEYKIIKSLVRVVRFGAAAKRRVDALLTSNDSGNGDLRRSIENCRQLAESSSKEHVKTGQYYKHIRKGLSHLKRYFLLIAYAAFLLQYREKNYFNVENQIEMKDILFECRDTLASPNISNQSMQDSSMFSEWMKGHPELLHMLDIPMESGMDALTAEALRPELLLSDGYASAASLAWLHSRSGAVLASGMILKEDHFPGCQILTNQLGEDASDMLIIHGGPNFRTIPIIKVSGKGFEWNHILQADPSSLEDMITLKSKFYHIYSRSDLGLDKLESYFETNIDVKLESTALPASESLMVDSIVHIGGIAIPTIDAIRKVVSLITAEGRSVLWTSLREEPLLYLQGRPYVLRSAAFPWSNLETTGIARERVEWMEDRMKRDVLREIRKYKGNFLLHGEVKNETGNAVLAPFIETIQEDEVLTPKEVFEKISLSNPIFKVSYHRLPITDEQTPIPYVFDGLIQLYWKLPERQDALFNCQMGRGRTTTGMIIATLIQVIVHRGLLLKKPSKEYRTSPTLYNKFHDGQYKIISLLLQVLEYGKMAKKITDICIDYCDHMQNLRLAIYDFKIKTERYPVSDHQDISFIETFQRGVNYLVRYFYLIAFTNYLLDLSKHISSFKEMDSADHSPQVFSSWLHERKEIFNLASNPNIDFS